MKTQIKEITKPSIAATVIASLLATSAISFAEPPSKDQIDVAPEVEKEIKSIGNTQEPSVNTGDKPLSKANTKVATLTDDAQTKEQTISKMASETPNLSILEKALQATGLDAALNGQGPFTVFAPTDEAFAKLPEGTLDMLMLPENKDKLAAILKHHVIGASIESKDVKGTMSVDTLAGNKLSVVEESGGVNVGKSGRVRAADIKASNGMIHIIDTVAIPSS